MKKSLIALAVASAVAAPAFAATSNVDVYGVLSIAIQDTDAANSDMTVLSNTSRIGFKGSEDLGGGMKAIWQVESGLSGNGSVTGQGAALANRNTFVGLSGGFGTALMGRHDTPYKLATGSLDPFADTIADYNLGRLDGVELLDNTHDQRSPQAVAYISPTVSGFHVAAAVVMGNNEAGSALTATTDTMDAYSLAAIYSNGPLFASLSYQNADAAGSDAWKVGVGYTFGDTKVGFIYEDMENDAVTGHPLGANAERDSWQLKSALTLQLPSSVSMSYRQNI